MRHLALALVVLSLSACAGRQTQSTTPIQLDTMRVTARQDADGAIVTNAYDAEMLFEQGLREMRNERCEAAVPIFDRVADEFEGSRFVSPALYDAGLCLRRLERFEEAADRFERLIREVPDSDDLRHATYQLLHLRVKLARWDAGLELADRMLRERDLTPDERVEAMALPGAAAAGKGDRDGAARQARDTLSWARTRRRKKRCGHPQPRGGGLRLCRDAAHALRRDRAAAGWGGRAAPGPRAARAALLDAQRAYFDSIRRQHPDWAAAAGYQIGAMYDTFWTTIMEAPTPPPASPLEGELLQVYEEEYRTSLARLVKPLVRHAIRYWELTLLMVERAGLESEWTERIREDLERARTRLLEQPEGPEGLPPPPPATPATTPPTTTPPTTTPPTTTPPTTTPPTTTDAHVPELTGRLRPCRAGRRALEAVVGRGRSVGRSSRPPRPP
ncbi:MAG: tetratricopeptide repeat protein [Polyangiales bacterium]